MADIDRLAEKLINRVLRDSGFVGKSAGSAAATRAQLMPHALAVAAGIAEVEDWIKALGKHVKRNGKALDRNGELIRQLAERHGVSGVTEVAERGWRRFDAESDVVGLVKQAGPKTMNGSNHKGDGVAPVPPPLWHPEAE